MLLKYIYIIVKGIEIIILLFLLDNVCIIISHSCDLWGLSSCSAAAKLLLLLLLISIIRIWERPRLSLSHFALRIVRFCYSPPPSVFVVFCCRGNLGGPECPRGGRVFTPSIHVIAFCGWLIRGCGWKTTRPPILSFSSAESVKRSFKSAAYFILTNKTNLGRHIYQLLTSPLVVVAYKTHEKPFGNLPNVMRLITPTSDLLIVENKLK